MSTRHRRVIYSSSDDDDNHHHEHHQQQQPQPNDIVFEDADDNDDDDDLEIEIPNISAVTLTTTTTTTATTAAAIEISDDDFIDVAENLSTPSPPPPPPSQLPQVISIPAATITPSDCQVNDELRKLGLYLKREWLNSCQLGLRNSVHGFENLDVESKAKLCFGQFLISDMNLIGAGLLPENVCGLHLVDLAGPFVLQVDEVVNISCHLKERYKNAAPGIKRCLKLSMTDGVQRVFGMEYRPIKSLAALSPAGFKVVIRNVNVRRGIFMLVPEVLEILGGSVEELEAARQRAVQEVIKPPRGKRTRNGSVPPLLNRATRAAWPQNGVADNIVPDNVANPVVRNMADSVVRSSGQLRADFQGNDRLGRTEQAVPAGRETAELPGTGGTGGNNQNYISRESGHESVSRESDQLSISRESVRQSISREAGASRETGELSGTWGNNQHSIRIESGNNSVSRESDQFSINRESGRQSINRESGRQSINREAGASRETAELSGTRGSNQHSISRESGYESVSRESVQLSINVESAQNCTPSEISRHSSVAEAHDIPVIRETTEPPFGGVVLNSVSTAAVEDEDAPMVDYYENPFILRGEREFPFSYLASLLSEWGEVQDKDPSVSSVQGKVKCILTGVKGFQYRNLSTFELLVFIDDGSLIMDVLIHHNVVRNRIGHSPQEITAIFTSSDLEAIESMKKTLSQFQTFLLTFEGTMLVEMSKTSRHPVVLEMTQSCLDVDPWQLLRRVKPPASSPSLQR